MYSTRGPLKTGGGSYRGILGVREGACLRVAAGAGGGGGRGGGGAMDRTVALLLKSGVIT